MNRFTNKFHTDLKHLTKRKMNMKTYKKEFTIEELELVESWIIGEIQNLRTNGSHDQNDKFRVLDKQLSVVKKQKEERKQ